MRPAPAALRHPPGPTPPPPPPSSSSFSLAFPSPSLSSPYPLPPTSLPPAFVQHSLALHHLLLTLPPSPPSRESVLNVLASLWWVMTGLASIPELRGILLSFGAHKEPRSLPPMSLAEFSSLLLVCPPNLPPRPGPLTPETAPLSVMLGCLLAAHSSGLVGTSGKVLVGGSGKLCRAD